MSVYKQGFEGRLLYGAAGSTAGTLITNSRDITETFDTGEGETTIRGSGSSPPIESFHVTSRKYSLEWQMTMKSDDSTLTALIAAAVAGTPVALHGESYSSGLGPDGDFNIKFKHGKPLKGEQTLDFSATVNNGTRELSLNV